MLKIEQLIQRLADGEKEVDEELFPLIYRELRGIAAFHLQGERNNHTLSPTALVHEAFLKLTSGASSYDSKKHFFRVAAKAMRQVLVDSARRKTAKKRGERPVLISLDEEMAHGSNSPHVELLNDAMDALEQHYPDLSELVTLRYFGGLTLPETADVMGVPLRTTERNWQFAKAWLKDAMTKE